MSAYLTILLQSILLPLGLSALLMWAGTPGGRYQVTGSALVWLLSYAWITGLPDFPPAEAVDWLWLLLVTGFISCCLTLHHERWLPLVVVLAGGLVAIAWPVLQYQYSHALAAELTVAVVVGGLIFRTSIHRQAAFPALSLAINASGLAIACALSGSLLVAQLTTALAAISGIYAAGQLLRRLQTPAFSPAQLLVFLPLYLGLLGIARIYAELPLASATLLLASPLLGSLSGWRHVWSLNLLLSAGAIAPLLLDSGSGYY